MDVTSDTIATLRAQANHPPIVFSGAFLAKNSATARSIGYEGETSGTLTAADRHAVSYSLSKNNFMTREEEEEVGTLVATDYKDPPVTVQVPRYVVRRISPVECERLQKFPDNWTDIGEWIDSKGKKRKTTDSARYKALGNSIALPYWKVLARKIAAQYDRDITMGSLFDGIGGFPLAFTHCGAECRWVSEIDDFPIAVTKYHWAHGDFK